MNYENYYVCKTIRLLTYLIKNDLVLKKVVDDKDNAKYKVFLFEDSEKLRQALEKYKTN